MLKAIIIDSRDNVGNLIGAGSKDEEVNCILDGESVAKIKLADDIPFNHKFALKEISKGEGVTKYGYPIGKATQDIKSGEYVHVHNIASNRGRGDLADNS